MPLPAGSRSGGRLVHPLADHPLPGIDPRRLQRLADAGLASLEDVLAAGPERLAQITDFDMDTCRALVRVARASVRRTEPGVVELVPQRDEPASIRLARGLEAARDLERAVSLVRKARSHAGRKRPDRWRKAHARARRQLKKLLATLEQLQRTVLSDGLSAGSREHLAAEIDRLEGQLLPLLDRPLRRRGLVRVRRAARGSRRRLHA